MNKITHFSLKSSNTSTVQSLITQRKRKGQPINDLFLKSLINLLYKENYDNKGEGLVSLKTVFRMTLVSGSIFLISPLAGVISAVADKLISDKVNLEFKDSTLKTYQKMIDDVNKKLSKTEDSAEKTKLRNLKSTLESKQYNLEKYFDSLELTKSKGDSSGFDDEDEFSKFDWEDD